MSWTTRPAVAADAQAVTDVFRLLDVAEFGEPEMELGEVTGLLDSEGPTLVAMDGCVVGFAHVQPNGECDTVVDPGYVASRELRGALLDWVLAQAPAAGATRLEHWAGPGDRLNAQALRPRGFRHSRTTWRMGRSLRDVPEPVWPEGVAAGDADPDELEAAWALAMRAFAGSPFSHPRPFEEWQRQIVEDGSVLVARAGGELVGCATRKTRAGEGYLGQLAVDPGWQGQGLGRALLLETFRRDAAAGRARTELTVDGENDSARALYDGVGMTVLAEYWRWDLEL